MSPLLTVPANLFLLLVASGILLLSLLLLLECGLALWPRRGRYRDDPEQRVRVAVLVPAHDEEMGIQPTLAAILPELQPQDQVLVVADNCTDATAEVARSVGATVLERQDPVNRGKGYALDYGLQWLAKSPPDVVVFMDADCEAAPGTIRRIATQAVKLNRPVQSVYLMEKPERQTPKDGISAFAFRVKNRVRPQGLAVLGVPCLLTGTGMAVPWSIVDRVRWATGNIVEDMAIGLDFALAGSPPWLATDTQVLGRLPQQEKAAKSQRTRWEHGHLQTLLTYSPRLLAAAIRQKRFDLLMLALDLSIPPLSLFVMLWLLSLLITLLAGWLGLSWLPAVVATAAGGSLLLAIAMAWLKFGQADLSLMQLLMVPFYILWKIPLYAKFLIKPQRKWVRTERDA